MATKKSKSTLETWPKVIVGSHSTRTEYEDGRVEFVTDWEALKRDVSQALREYEQKKLVNEAPYHPGYEGAVFDKIEEKVKKVRKVKTKTK
jgi:hypothetical protein